MIVLSTDDVISLRSLRSLLDVRYFVISFRYAIMLRALRELRWLETPLEAHGAEGKLKTLVYFLSFLQKYFNQSVHVGRGTVTRTVMCRTVDQKSTPNSIHYNIHGSPANDEVQNYNVRLKMTRRWPRT